MSKIEYKGKEIKIVFNLNVMQAIQEEYGSIEKWGSLTDEKAGEVNIKALVFGLTEMINEAIDIDNDENGKNEPFLSKKKVARIVSEVGIEVFLEAMTEIIVESTKDESGKNA